MNRTNALKCINVLFKRKYTSGREMVQMENSNNDLLHKPVMPREVIELLKPSPNQTIIDMTFGAGGHSNMILKAAPNVRLITVDRDPLANELAQNLSSKHPGQIFPILSKFSDLPRHLKTHKIEPNSIDGILFDFGCSSMQFDHGHRGFSLSKNGPLDMRMDSDPRTPSAKDVLDHATEEELARIIKTYGEEKQAKKIARAIVETRYSFRKLRTTFELADLVQTVCTGDLRLDKLERKQHMATKTFQALRIFVNDELNEIDYGMLMAHALLKVGGRLVTIAFHSLEDTIVKRHLQGTSVTNAQFNLPLKYINHTVCFDNEIVRETLESSWRPLNKHVVTPTDEEIDVNPRSRSGKLRAAVKVK